MVNSSHMLPTLLSNIDIFVSVNCPLFSWTALNIFLISGRPSVGSQCRFYIVLIQYGCHNLQFSCIILLQVDGPRMSGKSFICCITNSVLYRYNSMYISLCVCKDCSFDVAVLCKLVSLSSFWDAFFEFNPSLQFIINLRDNNLRSLS